MANQKNHPNGITVIVDGAQDPVFEVNKQGNVYIAAGARIAGSIVGDQTFSDDVTISGTLTVTGATTLSSTLGVTGLITATAGLTLGANTGIDGSGSILINDAGADVDVKIESDTNANHFVSDAGLFSGVGGFGFGGAANSVAYCYFLRPALTAAANSVFNTISFDNTAGAVTIPAGTASIVTALNVNEPNITATGTVADAYTVRIANAPTEGTRNGSLWVDEGTACFDGRITGGTGADVASANTLTLGADGNVFTITGNTQVNLITTTGWDYGARIWLRSTANPLTFAHNQTAGATTGAMLFSSSGNFTAYNNQMVPFVLTSTGANTGAWILADGR